MSNTNITLEYRLEDDEFKTINMVDTFLVDQGGYVNLERSEPHPNTHDLQADPGS